MRALVAAVVALAPSASVAAADQTYLATSAASLFQGARADATAPTLAAYRAQAGFVDPGRRSVTELQGLADPASAYDCTP